MPQGNGGVVGPANDPTTSTASGVWGLKEHAEAVGAGEWPAFVPALQVSRSLRFNSADSAYLSRTPASAGNRKTWTWSGWVKRGTLVTNAVLFGSAPSGTTYSYLAFTSNQLRFEDYNGSTIGEIVTTNVFRDTSAWYHIVAVLNTSSATSSDRMKLYVNGLRITSFSSETYPSLNADFVINNTNVHGLGTLASSYLGGYYFDGLMAEIHFIDNQALTPSDFGETDSITGVWKPKAYTGTYGTNGFHLDFSDNTSTTTLGYDAAGSNDWTLNNFSVAAGAGNDSLVDVPTRNTEDVDTGAGGEVRGNYCTVNALLKSANLTIRNGNLDLIANPATWNTAYGTFLIPSSGKWYWEVTAGDANTNPGIASSTSNLAGNLSTYPADTIVSYTYYGSSGDTKTGPGNTNTAYGATFTGGDVIGMAFDADAGTLTFYKNGSSQGTAFSSLTGSYVPVFGVFGNVLQVVNFGQRPFAHTAPSGFKALVTTNLPEPTVVQGDDHFNTVLYTGTASSQSITGVGFQPDMVWIKSRSSAYNNNITDAVRGIGRGLYTNNTDAEVYVGDTYFVKSFDTDGFSVENGVAANASGSTYVAWNWNAGGSNATNTDGTITSTVRANPTAGLSIVTYTGNGTAGATVGHGLGVAPKMVITKPRDTQTVNGGWAVYHASLGATKVLFLNTTSAAVTDIGAWNNTSPTSTVFSVGTNQVVNTNTSPYVAYCFAEINGYSKFSSYVGNQNTDGPFVYCGFRPAFILIKANHGVNWVIFDTARNTYNVTNIKLFPNVSDAETGAEDSVDVLSNGFKIRSSNNKINDPGMFHIFAAFAENPFKNSLAR